MPYVKRQPRYNKEGKIIRYDLYLAENKRIGKTVQTTIIRPLTSEEVQTYQDRRGVPSEGTVNEVKEPKEQMNPEVKEGITAILQIFSKLAENRTVASMLLKEAEKHPQLEKTIEILEEIINESV